MAALVTAMGRLGHYIGPCERDGQGGAGVGDKI
jgi:hypothetical protein